MKVFSKEEEQICLNFDPFFGDEGDIINLSDKFVTARKERECHICGEIIKKGDRIRIITDVFDGEFCCASICNTCCNAIIEDEKDLERVGDDDFEEKFRFEKRHEIRKNA